MWQIECNRFSYLNEPPQKGIFEVQSQFSYVNTKYLLNWSFWLEISGIDLFCNMTDFWFALISMRLQISFNHLFTQDWKLTFLCKSCYLSYSPNPYLWPWNFDRKNVKTNHFQFISFHLNTSCTKVLEHKNAIFNKP